MYVDKCHKYIDEKTKAHTGQVTGTKTKAYHICDLNRQLPKVPPLHFIPQS